MWDNLLTIVLLNIGYLALLGATVYVSFLFLSFGLVPGIIAAGVMIYLFSVYSSTVAQMTYTFSDYKKARVKQFLDYLKQGFSFAIEQWLALWIQVFIIIVGIPFYFRMNNFMGQALLGALITFCIVWWLAFQYYYPLRCRMKNDPPMKIIKKCFIILVDNLPFSIGLGIGSILIIPLSALGLFAFPGMVTVNLWHQVALKIRLGKYDYFDILEHLKNMPGETRLALQQKYLKMVKNSKDYLETEKIYDELEEVADLTDAAVKALCENIFTIDTIKTIIDDYINGQIPEKRIPWFEITSKDRDLVGVRTFKGMIFPWKD